VRYDPYSGSYRTIMRQMVKENRGFCKLKEEALDHTVWITGSRRGYGSVLRRMNE